MEREEPERMDVEGMGMAIPTYTKRKVRTPPEENTPKRTRQSSGGNKEVCQRPVQNTPER